ncbi:MAG TPA: right-handed parallel beta-helix repeat-containing protein [Chthoniobacteraceae bacterium]|nr:right-handed parallel beta-helix repeat-containing protein [Chthoniobacteraceae bacterium]
MIRTQSKWIAGLLLGTSLHASTLLAGVIHVAPEGTRGAAGTAEKPLASVQEALDRAQPGDVVRLRPGVYQERVRFPRSGGYGRPIVLEGEGKETVLDGSFPVKLEWRPAPEVAPGTWKAKVPQEVRLVTVNGRSVSILQTRRVLPGQVPRGGGPEWEYFSLFRNGVPGGGGWSGIRALALYLGGKERELLLRLHSSPVTEKTPLEGEATSLPEDLDPREQKITVGPPPNHAVVMIDGVDRCVVRNVTIRNAAVGVMIQHSLGAVVEGCSIGPVERGVLLYDGADRATIRFNEMFWNPYGEGRAKAKYAADQWQINKKVGNSDKHGILISQSAGGHEIHDNHIHHLWDGISVSPGGREVDSGLRIHHNRISTLLDDGIETNGGQVDCWWHHNLVEGTFCAVRLKAPDYGPFYVFGNIFLDNKEDLRNFGVKHNTANFDPKSRQWTITQTKRGSPVILPAIGYIYHNTSTARTAIVSINVHGIGVPNFHYFNNLFWCEYWWRNSPKANPSVDPNWKGDYNVYLRREPNERWEPGVALARRLKLDSHSRFVEAGAGMVDPANGKVALTPESPARESGVDLSRHFGQPLPGCEPGYFEGAAPDAGALPYGRAMPEIPRKRSSITVAEAGYWPGADAVRRQVPIPEPEE